MLKDVLSLPRPCHNPLGAERACDSPSLPTLSIDHHHHHQYRAEFQIVSGNSNRTEYKSAPLTTMEISSAEAAGGELSNITSAYSGDGTSSVSSGGGNISHLHPHPHFSHHQHEQEKTPQSNLFNVNNIAAMAMANSGSISMSLQTNINGGAVPIKKKRCLPGTPDPDAEVIALTPEALMATNRFVCEICNKGFQRDQNLQLHRRGHNLPWKLKQTRNNNGTANKEAIRKKVYICPEESCVHHDPRRALGDLTGIKKHFCRKHGEKKWKCEKCSKRYAVQSDWKAHSKTCGTREYRCDCGTLFSRRDSFITHRAFCDALVQEGTAATSRAASAAAPRTLMNSSFNGGASDQFSAYNSSASVDNQLYRKPEILYDQLYGGVSATGNEVFSITNNLRSSLHNSDQAPFQLTSSAMANTVTSFAKSGLDHPQISKGKLNALNMLNAAENYNPTQTNSLGQIPAASNLQFFQEQSANLQEPYLGSLQSSFANHHYQNMLSNPINSYNHSRQASNSSFGIQSQLHHIGYDASSSSSSSSSSSASLSMFASNSLSAHEMSASALLQRAVQSMGNIGSYSRIMNRGSNNPNDGILYMDQRKTCSSIKHEDIDADGDDCAVMSQGLGSHSSADHHDIKHMQEYSNMMRYNSGVSIAPSADHISTRDFLGVKSLNSNNNNSNIASIDMNSCNANSRLISPTTAPSTTYINPPPYHESELAHDHDHQGVVNQALDFSSADLLSLYNQTYSTSPTPTPPPLLLPNHYMCNEYPS